MAGTNATILAYGQTSSGKTHSVLGTPREPGLLPLAVEEIFDTGEGFGNHRRARVSYFEIFNERVVDLLASQGSSSSVASAHLPVKECAERGFYVHGLREAPVRCGEDVLRLVERGEERRRYAQTRWNDYSSRSHVLFTLTMETPSFASTSTRSATKLSIVDLAGCENHKQESSEDGRHINRSLFFLGEVISRLCAGGSRRGIRDGTSGMRSPSGPYDRTGQDSASGTPRQGMAPGIRQARSESVSYGSREGRALSRGREKNTEFIPYRDSKLTRVLRSSLGGNAVTLLLVTVHPAAQFVEQTLTSLRFAAKAQCVENHIACGAPQNAKLEDRSMIDAQQKIIEGLQEKLRCLEMEREPSRPAMAADPDHRGTSSRCFEDFPNRRWQTQPEEQPQEPTWQLEKAKPKPNDSVQESLGSWELQKEFRRLRTELAEKEHELASKARLLSERERQLGDLREQLEMAHFSQQQPALDLVVKPARHEDWPRLNDKPHWQQHEAQNPPVVDPAVKPSRPVLSHEVVRPANERLRLEDKGPEPESPRQVSRAEDIHCLRSASSYVTRQQSLPPPPPPPPPTAEKARAVDKTSDEGQAGKTQKELVQQLVQLAVMQINSSKEDSSTKFTRPAREERVKSGHPGSDEVDSPKKAQADKAPKARAESLVLLPPSNPDVMDTPRKASARSCDVDLSQAALRPLRGSPAPAIPGLER